MAPKIRNADGLLTLSAERLITTADDLNAALAAQLNGGPAATADKKNKKEALIGLLRRLRPYVEDN